MKKLLTLLGLWLHLGAAAQSGAPAPLPADSIRYWATHLNASMNANEALISPNWKSGGTSSLGASLLLNATAHYERDGHTWQGEVDFLYAGQYSQGEDGGYRKTNDRLYLDTKYGRAFRKNPKWSYFTALNLLSQFAPGYNYDDDNKATLISSFLAPAYLTSSFGVEYNPNKRFNLRLAPVAPRIILVRQPDRFRNPADTTIYGVKPGHSTLRQFGFQLLTQLDQPLGENVNLKVRYVLFIEYAQPRPVDNMHRLDLTLTAKINSVLNVSLGGIVLYDYNQDRAFQYSQNLSLGIAFDRNRPANRPR